MGSIIPEFDDNKDGKRFKFGNCQKRTHFKCEKCKIRSSIITTETVTSCFTLKNFKYIFLHCMLFQYYELFQHFLNVCDYFIII